MLLQPTPNGSSDGAYGPDSTSELVQIENEYRPYNPLSSQSIGEILEYYGEDYLDANDEWVFSSLYLYNVLWIKYSEIKNSYIYGKSSGESSLVSINNLHDTTDCDNLLKEIRIRICSKQILQFMLELNKNYEAEIFLEHSNTFANTNSAWIMCKKLCVDEWTISFAPIKNKNMRHIISTLTRLHFESGRCMEIFISKTNLKKIESHICKKSPNLSCLIQSTFSGDVICIRSNPNHPTENDITEGVRQLLDVMDSGYSDITIHGPLHEYPLCPRSIANITTTLRKKIKVCKIPQPTDIIRKVFQLKKHEVSFLMGFQGTRINSIRKSSSCVIKVLPFSTTMDATFIPLKNSPQDLVICGTPTNVQFSINLIQNYLMEYRNNNS